MRSNREGLKKRLKPSLVLFFVPFFALPASAAVKLPVVFAHGLGARPEIYEKIVPLQEIFARHGFKAYVAHTPAIDSIEDRAAALKREIERFVPKGRFHLVGHSMGGLDARYVISKLGLASRCASLTTIATPHLGSPVANFVVEHSSEFTAEGKLARQALDALGLDFESVEDLTTSAMARFNSEVPDDPRVKYFSLGYYIPEPIELYSVVPLTRVMHEIVKTAGYEDNDSLVAVESARWGVSLGTYPGDHFSETAPLPFDGYLQHERVFGRVMENLEEEF